VVLSTRASPASGREKLPFDSRSELAQADGPLSITRCDMSGIRRKTNLRAHPEWHEKSMFSQPYELSTPCLLKGIF
jgi:hypothetical protein